MKLTKHHLKESGWRKDDNGNYWKDYISHYIELLPATDYFYPTVVQVPEFSSEYEQRVHLNRINTVERLEELISWIN